MHVDISRAGGVRTLRRKYECSYPALPIGFPNGSLTEVEEKQTENDTSITGKYKINDDDDGGDDEQGVSHLVSIRNKPGAEFQSQVVAAVQDSLKTAGDPPQENQQRVSMVASVAAAAGQIQDVISETKSEVKNIDAETNARSALPEQPVIQNKNDDTSTTTVYDKDSPQMSYGTYGQDQDQTSYGTFGDEDQAVYGTYGDEQDQTSYGTFGDEDQDQTSYGTFGEPAEKLPQTQGAPRPEELDNQSLANRPLPDKPPNPAAATTDATVPDEIYEEIPNQLENATFPGSIV